GVSYIFNYFNYRVISDKLFNFSRNSKPQDDNFKDGSDINNSFDYSEKENSIEIPKIGVLAPLNFVEDAEKVHETLDIGVVHFPDSVLPGQKGQTIILGHSAPANWPDIKYDNVFSLINELEKGDQVFVYFDNKEYVYSVETKVFLEIGQDIPQNDLTKSDNMLVLVSCWPPGKNIKRIAVTAYLKIK
ncbi:MAG: sortase, partial [Candidatus Heimdallarchaeaceae archaeon]